MAVNTITKVQLRVLRKMMNTHVITLTHGGTFFRGGAVGKRDVRKQTIWALKERGLIENISDPAWRWRNSEYEITDAGREIVRKYGDAD